MIFYTLAYYKRKESHHLIDQKCFKHCQEDRAMVKNETKKQLQEVFKSFFGSDTLLNTLHSVSIGMDFGASILTTWAYSMEMASTHSINQRLFHGVIISVHSLPTLFLDGFIGQRQQQHQRRRKKKKKRSLYFALASQTVALFGSSFYACSFSPILIIFGRIWQGFLPLKFNRTFPVGLKAATKLECGSEMSYGVGIMISSLLIGLTRNLDYRIGSSGIIHIQYGNLSAVNASFTLVLLKMFTITTIHKRKIITLTSNLFNSTKKNYGSFVKHYKVKAKNYQTLQEKDERITKSILARSKLNWLEKFQMFVSPKDGLAGKTRELLFIGFISQFAIALTLFVWIITFGQRFGFRENLTNCFLIGSFGLSYSFSNSAYLFGFMTSRKSPNSLICLCYPLYLLGTLTLIHYLSLSKSTETMMCGSCLLMAAVLKTIIRQKYIEIVSKEWIFVQPSISQLQRLTRFDFYRMRSILDNVAVICAAMTSGYFWKFRSSFYIGYGTFSLIAVVLYFTKLKEKQNRTDESVTFV